MTPDGELAGERRRETPDNATGPINLTDPDGSVTLVAPWSTWTREQVRAPGGEPSLVTRLDEGQLWFASGRPRSPWRHEVIAGPATVTTPRGRFQVIAEADGGATIVCLAGRTRVLTGTRDPVLLGPNQTASLSMDGSTLIVTDSPVEPSAPTSTASDIDTRAGTVLLGEGPVPTTPVAPDVGSEPAPLPAVTGAGALDEPSDAGGQDRQDGSRRPWLAELVAVAAILAVLLAAAVVFRPSSDEGTEAVAPPVATSTSGRATTTLPATTTVTVVISTSPPPASTSSPPVATEPPPASTSPPPVATAPPPATAAPPPLAAAAPATATGILQACRRVDGGVEATVQVTHRSGGSARFAAEVGLVDSSGRVFARGQGQSKQIDERGTASVQVVVAVAGSPRGACELLGVAPAQA